MQPADEDLVDVELAPTKFWDLPDEVTSGPDRRITTVSSMMHESALLQG